MFVCVVLLSQPSSRDLDYPVWDVLYQGEIMYKKPCVFIAGFPLTSIYTKTLRLSCSIDYQWDQ